MDKQQLITKLVTADNNRARSKQTAIGVSQLGGCKRQVWHQLNGDERPNENNVLRLPAIMGTAIHSAIEQVVTDDTVLIEHRVEIDGYPPATIDYFDTALGEVVDWKTITLKNIPYFVTQQKRWQVQVYGFLMAKDGYDVKTVKLIGIPRDGTERDIIEHSEPYDEAIALEALQWLEDVKAATVAPEPERDAASFCKNYCPFFGLCAGRDKNFKGEAITDQTWTDAAAEYIRVSNELKTLELRKDALKDTLAGANGVTFDGVQVSWSEIAGRSTVDVDAVKALLGNTPIPMKQGDPSLRLTVK